MATDAFNKFLDSYNKNGYNGAMEERFPTPKEESALNKVKNVASEALSLPGKALNYVEGVIAGNDNSTPPQPIKTPSNSNILDETYNTVNNILKRNESSIPKFIPPHSVEGPLTFQDTLRSQKPLSESALVTTPDVYNRGDRLISQKTYNESLPWDRRDLSSYVSDNYSDRDVIGGVADTVKTALFQMGLTVAKPLLRATGSTGKTPEEQRSFESSLLRDQLGKSQAWTPEDADKNIQYAQKAGGLAGDLVGLAAGTLVTGNPIAGAALWGGTSAYGEGGGIKDVAKGAASNAAFMAVAGPVTKLFEGIGSSLLKSTPNILKNSLIADVANKFVSGGIGGVAGTLASSQINEPGVLPSMDEILSGAATNAFFHGIPGAIESVKISKANRIAMNDVAEFIAKSGKAKYENSQGILNPIEKAGAYREILNDIQDAKSILKNNRFVGASKEVGQLKQILDYGENNFKSEIVRLENQGNSKLGSEQSNISRYPTESAYSPETPLLLSKGESIPPAQESPLRTQPIESNTSNIGEFLPKQNTFDNMVRNLPRQEQNISSESALSLPNTKQENTSIPQLKEPYNPNTVNINNKTWYHGTGTEGLKAQDLDPNATKIDGLFGHGIYMTDNPDIAKGYAKSRGKRTGTPVVYESNVNINKVLDLEKPMPEDAFKVFDDYSKILDNRYGYGVSDELIKLHSKGATGDEVYRKFSEAIGDISHGEMVPQSEFVEDFAEISSNLRNAGYDAYTHIGGKRTGNDPHQVLIMLDPNDNFGAANSPKPPSQITKFNTMTNTTQKVLPNSIAESSFKPEHTTKEQSTIKEYSKPLNHSDGFENLKVFQIRINDGKVTAQELRNQLEYMDKNKDSIIKDILTKMSTLDQWKRKSIKTKQEAAEKYFNEKIHGLAYSVNDTLSVPMNFSEGYHSSVIKAARKVLENVTDEDIQNHRKAKAESIQSMQKHREDIQNKIDKPETLEDYKLKIRSGGKLTYEEQIKYDELYSLDAKARREEKSHSTLPSQTLGNFNIIEDVDTRDNSKLWVIKLSDRVSKEEYNRISGALKPYKIIYSRYKKGFISKTDPSDVMKVITGESPMSQEKPNVLQTNADKLRNLAEGMQSSIDDKFRDRLANTARRAGMAANAEAEGEGLKLKQQTLFNLADAMEAGKLKLIDKIDSKAQLNSLNQVMSRARGQYVYKEIQPKKLSHDDYQEAIRKLKSEDIIPYVEIPGEKMYKDQLQRLVYGISKKPGFKLIASRFQKLIDSSKSENELIDLKKYEDDLKKIKTQTNELKSWTMDDSISEKSRLERMGIESPEELRAYLREYVKYKGESKSDPNRKIKEMERNLLNRKFEGYFPTPAKVVDEMLTIADIQPGDKVLEPSAGKGNIADIIKKKQPGANIDVIEIQPALREVLEAKGYNLVDRDFMNYEGHYDKIIMNPPFENMQDVDHVRHAYDLLNPNGKLVAIMSESPFFRSDKKSADFRGWLDNIGGKSEKLPEGSFKLSERSTGVNTRLVSIDKTKMDKTSYKKLEKQLPDTVEELQNVIDDMRNKKVKLIDIDLQLFAAAEKKLSTLQTLEKLKKQKSELITQAELLDAQSKFVESGKVYEKLLDTDKQMFENLKQLDREVPYASLYLQEIEKMKKGFQNKLTGLKYVDMWKRILERKDSRDLLNTKLSEQKEKYENKLDTVKNESRSKISDLKTESRSKLEEINQESRAKQEDIKKEFRYRLKKQKYDIQQRYQLSKERQEYIKWWRENVETENKSNMIWETEQLKKRNAEIKKERNKIYSKLKDISRKVNEMRPEYKKLVQSILSDIDLGVKNKRSNKTISRLEKLREYIQNNPDNTIPEDVLSKLTLLSKKPFGDITIEELRTIYRSVAHFVHLNQLKNSLIMGRKVYNIKNDLKDMLSNIMKKNPKISEFENILDSRVASNYDKLNNKHKIKELLTVSHYNPEMLSQVLDHAENGPIKRYFYDNFNEATNNKIEFEDAARKHFRDGLKSIGESWESFSEIFAPKINKIDYQKIELPSGGSIRITKGQRVSLYLHSLSTDNMRHIILGGIRLPKKTGWTPYKLSLEDFKTVISSMTPSELKVANLASEYFDTLSKSEINKVSVNLYGYELADVKNYFPINSDSSYVERNLIKPKTTYLKDIIENFGFTKARTKGANPILLRDVFDVVLDSIDKVSTFIGFAEPVRNARYILSNVDFKNTLIRHYGNEYLRYLEKYVDDIESIDYTPSPILDNFRRNADTALLALNPWVIAKQPISYVMAATEISSKYLAAAIVKSPDFDEINKYSPQLRRRLEGDISPEMGELGEFNKPRSFFLSAKAPISQRMTDGILAGDRFIIGRTWEAVKIEMKEKYPGLSGDEFFEKVAERTEEIVRRTNSVFEVKDRTAIGRSKNEIFKTFLRFSSQRFVMLNGIRRALLRYSINGNKFNLVHALLTMVVVQSLLLQSINALRDWLYGRDTDNSIASWVFNIATDTTSLVGGVGEAINAVKYALKTNRGVELSAPSIDALSDLLTGIKDSIIAVNQFAFDEVYKTTNKKTGTYKGDSKWNKTATKAIDEMLSVFSRIKGLPYVTIKNMIKGLSNKINGN